MTSELKGSLMVECKMIFDKTITNQKGINFSFKNSQLMYT